MCGRYVACRKNRSSAYFGDDGAKELAQMYALIPFSHKNEQT